MKRSSVFTAFAMAGALAGCGGTDPTATTANCTPTMGMEAKYVANTLTVPQSKSDYAMDLNGDGKPDNQLGNIIGALTAQNLDTQMGVDMALAMGNVVLLLDQTGADLTNNDCNQVTVQTGNMQANPKFDGTDTFTVNSAFGGGSFFGKIMSGMFSSTPPATAATPTTVVVQLPLVAGSDPVELDITGAHIQFTASNGSISKGQINGAIKNDDVQNKIIPNVAKLLSDKVASGQGMANTNAQILSIFDTGGGDPSPDCNGYCKGIDGVCGVPMDGKIQVCEVATNSIIKNVLAPDVQMFQGGVYKPNSKNEMKDSLSLGLSFTAVKASF
jgi:hypothetical protein